MSDCQDVGQHLYQYLDRELTPEEARDIEAHLDRCDPCFQLERFESGIIKLVRRDCGSEKAPDHLRKKLAQVTRSEG